MHPSLDMIFFLPPSDPTNDIYAAVIFAMCALLYMVYFSFRDLCVVDPDWLQEAAVSYFKRKKLLTR